MGLRRILWIIAYLLLLAVVSLFIFQGSNIELGQLETILSRPKLAEMVRAIPDAVSRLAAPWREETVTVSTDHRFIWPVEGEILAAYGWQKHPLTQIPYYHRAVDISCPEETPIRAVLPGRVERAYYGVTLGNTIIVRHDQGWTSGYAHLSEALVEEGDLVSAGSLIGKCGTSGLLRLGTDPHLHFMLFLQDSPVDPEEIFSAEEAGRNIQ